MQVLITGANGFVGKNLTVQLSEREGVDVRAFTRENTESDLHEMVKEVDFIFHLAGVNRPENPQEFREGNLNLTSLLCDAIISSGRKVPVLYTSSIQAELDNEYGVSKKLAEEALAALQEEHNVPVYLYRLPNVFGKWTKPNYNSVVATFCHNISQGLPIKINDPDAEINLVYIDDVVSSFLSVLEGHVTPGFVQVDPQYKISLGELASQLEAFRDSRDTLTTESVGTGLTRALYSTYVSYFKPQQFSYSVVKHADPRGVFVEMLKTKTAGQFSYFTANPGVTRGGHYHHSKTEKFLVIKGSALFRFRHVLSGEFYELKTSGESPEIVETATGWSHDITNIGDDEMVVMLWANEVFDQEKPDTYASPLVENE